MDALLDAMVADEQLVARWHAAPPAVTLRTALADFLGESAAAQPREQRRPGAPEPVWDWDRSEGGPIPHKALTCSGHSVCPFLGQRFFFGAEALFPCAVLWRRGWGVGGPHPPAFPNRPVREAFFVNTAALFRLC